jgi:PPOX class probable F420-dependent enzyme
MLDFTTDFGKRAAERLRTEEVAWLTTVGGDGQPQPSPVWFLWEGESALIYSRPGTPKVRNIERHPRVALNFNSDAGGGDVVILTGEARIDPDAPTGDQHPAYLEKYAAGIARIGMNPAQFATEYNTAIRFTPTKLRGH